MSFEYYIDWYRHGESTAVPVADVRKCFGTLPVEEDTDHWLLQYDDMRRCHLYLGLTQETYCDNVAVMRPCDHPALHDSILELLKLGSGVMYYPGCPVPAVASADVANHLPQNILDALGNIIVVKSGEDIIKYARTGAI